MHDIFFIGLILLFLALSFEFQVAFNTSLVVFVLFDAGHTYFRLISTWDLGLMALVADSLNFGKAFDL